MRSGGDWLGCLVSPNSHMRRCLNDTGENGRRVPKKGWGAFTRRLTAPPEGGYHRSQISDLRHSLPRCRYPTPSGGRCLDSSVPVSGCTGVLRSWPHLAVSRVLWSRVTPLKREAKMAIPFRATPPKTIYALLARDFPLNSTNATNPMGRAPARADSAPS